ncbi:MAG TPA: alcohol dehydrogenase catalytic domain-containing protein [Planctomycetota bacterium]|nr:alcohol dehydrogenase catalytic domain-containing protein [Planctomycetota bacterium]
MNLPSTMRAAVLHGREDLRLESVPLEAPEPGGLIVRMDTALTCGTDLKVWRRGYHAAMIHLPGILGHEGAGVVAQLGEGAVSDSAPGLRVGDRVVVANSAPCASCRPCGRGQENLCDDLKFLNGTYAEYLRVPARFVRCNTWRVPGTLPLDAAALTEPLACVVHGLRETPVRPGDRALVIGLGPVGLLWVALLKNAGAEVHGAGRHAPRLEAARRLGAQVIEADLPGAWVAETASRGHFDLVVEATGRIETWNLALNLVAKGGAVNLFGGPPKGTHASFDTNHLHYRQVTLKSPFHHRPESFRASLDLLARGVVPSEPFLTDTRRLEELPEVFRGMAAAPSGVKTRIKMV